MGRGNLAGADALADGIGGWYARGPQNALSCPFTIAVARKDFAQTRAMLTSAIADYEKNGGSESTIAESFRMLGDPGAARPWYEKAYEARDTLVLFAPYEKFQSHALVDSPPWKALPSAPGKPRAGLEAKRKRIGRR